VRIALLAFVLGWLGDATASHTAVELDLAVARARASIAIVIAMQPGEKRDDVVAPVPPQRQALSGYAAGRAALSAAAKELPDIGVPLPSPPTASPPVIDTTQDPLGAAAASRPRQVVIMTQADTAGCAPCARLAGRLDGLRAAKWDIGSEPHRLIRVINVDQNAEYAARYETVLSAGVPVLMVYEAGNITRILRGSDVARLTAYGIADIAEPGNAARQPTMPQLTEPQ